MKRRRGCHWKEFRLCTASRPGEGKTRYGLTDGSPFEAGCMMYQTARAEGMGGETRIHGVGDGVPWIEEQYEEQFGANHSFLIDFYHVGEYLAAAAKEVGDVAGEAGRYLGWKERMLAGKAEEVIAELGALRQEHPQKQAVEACHRYLGNRAAHLRYAEALCGRLADRLGGSGKRTPQRATEAAEETRSMVAQAERRKHGTAQKPTSQRPLGKSLAKTGRVKNTDKNHTRRGKVLGGQRLRMRPFAALKLEISGSSGTPILQWIKPSHREGCRSRESIRRTASSDRLKLP